MVDHQLARLDSLDERDAIRRILRAFRERNNRCAASWREVNDDLRTLHIEISRLAISPENGVGAYHTFEFDSGAAPLDPTGTPYRLINGGCDVDLDPSSKVAR
jgi:hypothetical protein